MKKILFADDDPTIRDVINLILEDEYDLTILAKGEPLLQNEFIVPDLFLLDRQLSNLDGLDICRFLKGQETTKSIPVIMISATPGIEALALSAGADNVIEKPFPIRQLRQMIAQYI